MTNILLFHALATQQPITLDHWNGEKSIRVTGRITIVGIEGQPEGDGIVRNWSVDLLQDDGTVIEVFVKTI